MSISETPATPAAPQPPRRSRLRRVLVGGALILSGVVIGVATTAVSQDYGRDRGWFDGPRWHDRGGYRDDDRGPRGGDRGGAGDRSMGDNDRDGDRRPGFAWHHGGGRFGGGQFLTPGRIERMVNRVLWVVDGSTDQKQKIGAILRSAADDLYPLREKHMEGRQQIREVLAAPTIDRAKLEALRVQQMQLADTASKRLTAAIADAGDVLTPAQRADLGKRFDQHAR
jgi:Spy/CpxP family protein refolding chaperone